MVSRKRDHKAMRLMVAQMRDFIRVYIRRLSDDLDVADVVFRIEPERIRLHALEQVGRQDGGAGAGAHRAAHAMQTWGAKPEVKLVGVISHIIEVMCEVWFLDELVDFAQSVFGFAGQSLITQQ